MSPANARLPLPGDKLLVRAAKFRSVPALPAAAVDFAMVASSFLF